MDYVVCDSRFRNSEEKEDHKEEVGDLSSYDGIRWWFDRGWTVRLLILRKCRHASMLTCLLKSYKSIFPQKSIRTGKTVMKSRYVIMILFHFILFRMSHFSESAFFRQKERRKDITVPKLPSVWWEPGLNLGHLLDKAGILTNRATLPGQWQCYFLLINETFSHHNI